MTDAMVLANMLERSGEVVVKEATAFLLEKCKIKQVLKEWKEANPNNTFYAESGLLRFWKSFLGQITREVFDGIESEMDVKISSDYNQENLIRLGFETHAKKE